MSRVNQSVMANYDREWALAAHKQFPAITSYGWGLPEGCGNNWADGLDDDSIDQVIRARDFLMDHPAVKNAGPSSPTSSQLKSLVPGYVYEGAVVLAAEALGYPVKRDPESPRVRIGLKKSRLKYARVRG